MRARSLQVQVQPNVTPMVDVMLVLLIVFMVVAPALIDGSRVEPPIGANLTAHPDAPSDVTLSIDLAGQYYLNKRPIRHDELRDRLTDILARPQQDRIMFLRADRGLEYERVLDALSIATASGMRFVGMVSTPPAGRPPAR